MPGQAGGRTRGGTPSLHGTWHMATQGRLVGGVPHHDETFRRRNRLPATTQHGTNDAGRWRQLHDAGPAVAHRARIVRG